MDAKEIKAAIKEAREEIGKKDYKAALRHCKSVLKADKSNYVALVLCGVALQELEQLDQALQALKRAADSSPDQLLAWKGLSSFYEKNDTDANKQALVPVYEKLMELYSSDLNKFIETSNKLAQLSLQLQDLDKCMSALKQQIRRTDGEADKQKSAWKTVANILTQQVDLSAEHSELMEAALKNVLEDSEDISTEDCKAYLKVLYRNKKLVTLIKEVVRLQPVFGDSLYPLEWVCKVYVEIIGSDEKVLIKSIEAEDTTFCYEKLLTLNSASGLGLLAKGTHQWQKGLIAEARDSLQMGLDSSPSSVFGWRLLAQCLLSLCNFCGAESSALQGLTLAAMLMDEDPHKKPLTVSLNCVLIAVYYHQAEEVKLEKGVALAEEILSDDDTNCTVLIYLAKLYAVLGKFTEVERIITKLSSIEGCESEVSMIKVAKLRKEGKDEEAIRSLGDVVAKHPNLEAWIELGKMQWGKEEYTASVKCFLQAAKLNPQYPVSFMYLGHYYRHHGGDVNKARRCYQKAFQLNPDEPGIGAALSDIYRDQGDLDANLQLLLSVTRLSGVGSAKWAWLRLGMHYLQTEDFTQAIASLQCALRADPLDSHCWECLGDAYMTKGSYTSAFKAFDRALELDPTAVYPSFQMATIKQLLGEYSEAISEYRDIISKHKTYVPALKGLGEALLCLARAHLVRYFNGCARDCCEEALHYLTVAAGMQSDLACMWKLMGEVCSLLSPLPEHWLKMKVPSVLLYQDPTGQPEVIQLQKKDILQLGARCYLRALQLLPDNDSLWHDLSLIYSSQADTVTTPEEKHTLRERAVGAVKKAVCLAHQNYRHWNALGILACSKEISDYPLAQHSFIKAIKCDSSSAVTWTNLGTLYIILNKVQLAHEAFKVAQNLEPSYIGCWIGQALVAESVGHEESMDLFRHTTQLGNHCESSIGYGHWVCNTLQDLTIHKNSCYQYSIEKMHAIPSATDGLTRYTGRIQNNPCAYNMFGLLLERQQLHEGALLAFQMGLSLLVGKEDDSDWSEMVDKVRANYARVLAKLGKYEEAIQQYQAIKGTDFYTQCGLALTNARVEKYDESRSVLEAALEWLATDDSQKSHVLVAMATMIYKTDMEEAKELLFKSCKLQPPSVPGLFALCSLGLLNSDMELTTAALREMSPFLDNDKYLSDINFLRSCLYIQQGQLQQAVSMLSKAVHIHPNIAALWQILTMHLLQCRDTSGHAAARCARAAATVGTEKIDVSKLASLVSLSYLIAKQPKESLVSSEKAVHLYPNVPHNWCVLVASYLPKCVAMNNVSGVAWLKKVISHVRRKQEAEKRMSQWLSGYERKITLILNSL